MAKLLTAVLTVAGLVALLLALFRHEGLELPALDFGPFKKITSSGKPRRRRRSTRTGRSRGGSKSASTSSTSA